MTRPQHEHEPHDAAAYRRLLDFINIANRNLQSSTDLQTPHHQPTTTSEGEDNRAQQGQLFAYQSPENHQQTVFGQQNPKFLPRTQEPSTPSQPNLFQPLADVRAGNGSDRLMPRSESDSGAMEMVLHPKNIVEVLSMLIVPTSQPRMTMQSYPRR